MTDATTLPPAGRSDLAAVEAALLARARADADALRSAAVDRAGELLAAAQRQADEIVAAARAEGAADAAEALRGERSRTRREARARVLHAERTAYDELRRRSVERVAALVDDDRVAGRLAEEAAHRLGPGARLGDHGARPRAVLGERRLTVVPEDLVDRAIASLGLELPGLWSP